MKTVFSISWLVALGLWSAVVPTNAQVNVVQYHNNSSRDGLYIDSAFTQSAAANLTRDLNFNGTIVGNVYAQPLYLDNGPGGRPTIIAVTAANNVYAIDAVNGTIIWQRNVGPPVPAPDIFCGEIGSAGIAGTPVVDLASRALFLNALTTPDGGATLKHYIVSLNVDTGAINPGWPVDVELTAQYNGTTFVAASQSQSGALGIVGNILYVGYGSHTDCGVYRGWLVGVPINNPASVTAWATSANGGGIWSASGVASDGTNAFVSTGNTFQPPNWRGGEAVIRFQPGPIFSGNSSDYWVPLNWSTLDQQDTEIAAAGPILVDVPGATPSRLIVQMGKDEFAHLLNRDNLGGIAVPVAEAREAFDYIYGGPAAYRTAQGTYIAFREANTALSTFRITATSPPTIAGDAFNHTPGWSTYPMNGCGSPWVTSTDGTNNVIVWVVGTSSDNLGSDGDQRLHGYDGDTGAVVYGGGGANELMAGMHRWRNTGIVARGRLYVAGDNKVYAFKLPGGTPTPTPTPTSTATPTSTPTSTPPPPTPTPTPSATATPTATPTPTATATPTSPPGNTCHRQMTIDHTKVPSTQSNFTVLVSVTDPALKTVANGGHVANANGYDIGFYADSGGSTKLKWEVEKYNGTTGNLIAWVKIPSVSSTTDTPFYLFYGDPSIVTNQSDPVNTWDSNYKAVYHLGNGTTFSGTDSTAQNNSTNNGLTAAAGQFVGGATVGSGNYALNSNVVNTAVATVSAWVKANVATGRLAGFSDGNGGFIADKNIFLASTHKAAAYGYDTGPKTAFGATTITTGAWHYIVGVFNGTNVTVYIDGSSDGSTACGNTFVGYAHPDLLLGGIDRGSSGDIGSSTYLNGIIDEPRFSSVARSAAWIAAEYNNQNSPGTFITMGSESCPSATPTPTPTATPTPAPSATPGGPTPHPVACLTITASVCGETDISWCYCCVEPDPQTFVIERGTDNVTFTEIARLQAWARFYSDTTAPAGTNFYRFRTNNVYGDSTYTFISATQPACGSATPAPTTPPPSPTPAPTATATPSPTPGQITLSALGYKVQGLHKVDLSWTGANSSSIDVYRDGLSIVTVPNNGLYTDDPNDRGQATYIYEVCEAGTGNCSNQVTVNF